VRRPKQVASAADFSAGEAMLDLYLELDARGVYPQLARAAQRHALDVFIVSNDYLPTGDNVHLIAIEDNQVNGGAWVLANIGRGDICVTANSGLAVNCILRGALALSPSGRQWGADAVGDDAKGFAEPWAANAELFAQRLEKAIASARAMSPRPLSPPPRLSRTGVAGSSQRARMSRPAFA
jgi:uncharacterized protein YaiI (UPF0178 family)